MNPIPSVNIATTAPRLQPAYDAKMINMAGPMAAIDVNNFREVVMLK